MRLYIDGGLVGEKTTSVVPLLALDSTQTPGLGIRNTQDLFDFPLLGAIDEVVLYNHALSPAELATVVPEPGSVSLGVIAFAGFLIYHRKKR